MEACLLPIEESHQAEDREDKGVWMKHIRQKTCFGISG